MLPTGTPVPSRPTSPSRRESVSPPRLRELRRFEPGGRAGFSDSLGPERERALALLRDRAHEPRRVLQGCEEGSVRRLPREMAARVLFL